MSDEGFIIIQRRIENWQWWGNIYAMAIWLYIIENANWKDGYWSVTGEKVERGCFITSKQRIAEELNISRNTVDRWLKQFEKCGQITCHVTGKYTRINVVNYGKYQAYESVRGQVIEQETEQETEHNRTKKQSNKETKKQYSRQAEPPTWEEVESFAYAIGYIDPLPFYRQMENSGWTYKGEPVKEWRRLLRGFKRQQDMDRSKAMASHQRQTEHLPEYMKQPQPEPEGTDQELMAEMLEWQRKNGGQT